MNEAISQKSTTTRSSNYENTPDGLMGVVPCLTLNDCVGVEVYDQGVFSDVYKLVHNFF
jgi:hypothetical protein